jgi:hypothetical protein
LPWACWAHVLFLVPCQMEQDLRLCWRRFQSPMHFFGQQNDIYKVVEAMMQSVTRGCLVLIQISSETDCSPKRMSKLSRPKLGITVRA